MHDKKDSLVETKYKVCENNNPVYTANMYHTTCSCLVNGKNSNTYMERDLSKIIEIVETSLSASGITIPELNANIKHTLHTILNRPKTSEQVNVVSESSASSIDGETLTVEHEPEIVMIDQEEKVEDPDDVTNVENNVNNPDPIKTRNMSKTSLINTLVYLMLLNL